MDTMPQVLMPAGDSAMSRAESLARAQSVIRAIVARQHDRMSLVPQIACEIGAEIVEGIIPPRHDLNTVELARRYRTSRTPVREALILLENEGLVDIEPRRRPRARIQSMPEVREIYRTRAVLLELMAGDVARRITDAEITVLREVLQRMDKAVSQGDAIAYAWFSVEFHDHDARMSGNATAQRIHNSLLLRTIPIRRISVAQPHRMERSLDDHVQLVKAYERRDPYLASAILRANHTASLAAVQDYFDATGSLEPLSPD